jgi:hypothetical protein
MAGLVSVFLLGLAAIGSGQILRIAARDAIRWGAVVLIGFASLLEVTALPARLWSAPALREEPGWVEWLAERPQGAVAMIPFAGGGKALDYEPTALAMVLALSHGKPLVNGYSGLCPQSYEELSTVVVREFPSARSLARLRQAGVTYLVIDREWLTARREGALGALGAERELERDGVVIYLLRA